MLIGSNNSLTYLRPSSWWSKFVKWFGRCQTISYEKQYINYGVRLFDIRVYTNEFNRIIIRNGIFQYKIFSFYEVLDFFDKMGDVTVLITLDETEKESLNKKTSGVEYKFSDFCRIIETVYPNVMYIGGYRRFDGKKLYQFEYEKVNGMPKIINGCQNSWIYRIFPFLSKKKNSYFIKKHQSEGGFIMLNFIDKR